MSAASAPPPRMAGAGSRANRVLHLVAVSLVSFLLGSLSDQVVRVSELALERGSALPESLAPHVPRVRVASSDDGLRTREHPSVLDGPPREPAAPLLRVHGTEPAKPALRLGYCTFEPSDESTYGNREAEWVVSLLRGPLSTYYDVTVSSFSPEPGFLHKRGAALSPQDEWRALGLDLDVRVCFFGTTKVVEYMVARGGRLSTFSPPKSVQLRWTADGFVHWPSSVSFVADASGRRMGPMLVRASSEPWRQATDGCEVQLETKRPVDLMPSASVAVYHPYLVGHLGRRQWPLSDAPGYQQFVWADYVGCCVSPGPAALEDAATRVGFFDAAAELRQKTGFVGFLQRNCGSSGTPQTHIRHAFLYALHNFTGKPITQLGECPSNLDELESVVRMGQSAAERLRSRDEVRRSKLNTVEVNRRFKFVVCFENSDIEGYLTEKLMNAYLARSVPVYFGGGEGGSFLQAINPKALVRCESPALKDGRLSESGVKALRREVCPDFNTLKAASNRTDYNRCVARLEARLQEIVEPAFRACLEQVRALDNDDRAYKAMISEPLMPNGGQRSGPWNVTHLAESVRLVYEAVVKGSGRFQYEESSWQGKSYSSFRFGEDGLKT
jgi:hypothetical protein